MVCGYFEEARRYDDLVKGKSSGQQSSTLLSRLQDVLKGGAPLREYQFVNWTASEQVEDFENAHNVSESNWRANVLKRLYAEASEGMPMLLLDEPEQSLDAMAEVSLWRQIAKVDCSRVQVVVATHSLFPLMHPEQFNIIEATPSYVREVRVLM
jgi:predicted ATPase